MTVYQYFAGYMAEKSNLAVTQISLFVNNLRALVHN